MLLHWWIEFPEVFFEERPDPLQGGEKNGAAMMEGVVGNPPFAGKNTITESSGAGMLDWRHPRSGPEVKGSTQYGSLRISSSRRAADLPGATRRARLHCDEHHRTG